MSFASGAYAAVQRNPMQAIGWVLAFALILVLGLRGEDTRDKVVKVINKSPCYTDVDGKPCQRTKRKSDEERSVSSTCVLFYKVDKGGKLLRFTKCPVDRSPGPSLKSNAPAANSGGGAATDTLLRGPRDGGGGNGSPRGGDGRSAPGDGGSGGPSAPGKGGKPPALAPDPAPSPVPPESAPTSSPGRSGDAPGNPDPPASPPPGTVPSTVEAAGGAVKEAGEGAGKAVEGLVCGAVPVAGCPR